MKVRSPKKYESVGKGLQHLRITTTAAKCLKLEKFEELITSFECFLSTFA